MYLTDRKGRVTRNAKICVLFIQRDLAEPFCFGLERLFAMNFSCLELFLFCLRPYRVTIGYRKIFG